jgi:hypothetical protein
MSGWHVGQGKWQTCICGKVCKGQAALANHSRRCDLALAYSEAYIAAIESGQPVPTERQFLDSRQQLYPTC